MADDFSGFTPIEGDPIAPAFEEENGQSVDPLLDPEEPSTEPASNDPALETLLGELRETGQSARALADHPIPVLVAEIHEEIQQILRLHRDICDGVELATDQVQDKRIDFLEAGPEATIGDVFMEVALVFFLESPLVGLAVKKALKEGYRFAAARRLASRTDKLERLRAAAQKFRAPGKGVPLAHRERMLELQQLELDIRLQLHRSPENAALLNKRLEILQSLMDDLSRKAMDESIKATAKAAGQRPTITAKVLEGYFTELDSVAAEYGVGLVKSGVAAAQKASAGQRTAATDSIGVQIKSHAQFQLRKVELHLGLAAANADLLRSVAQSEPPLAPACFALLSEMHASLQRAGPSNGKEREGLDVRHAVMLEVEKLIWAMLTPDEILDRPQLIRDLEKLGDEQPFRDPFLDSFVLAAPAVASVTGQPSARYVDYLKGRFFPDDPTLTTGALLDELKALKAGFLEMPAGELPIQIISVRFKSDAPAKDDDNGNGQSTPP